MKTKAIALSLLILCAPGGLLAQEKPELFSRIERVFREQEMVFRSARGQA